MKQFIKKFINRHGYNISRLKKLPDPDNPHAELNLKYNEKIVDLEALAQISLDIPGMIAPKSGQVSFYIMLYAATTRWGCRGGWILAGEVDQLLGSC